MGWVKTNTQILACLIPFGLSIVQFQKMSLDFTFCRVVSSQSNICSNEVHVDWTCLQPDRAPQQRGLTQWLCRTLSRCLQPGGLSVLLLLNVLPDVDFLHHSTDTLSHRLVVKVAVSYTNDTRLCGVKGKRGYYFTYCFKLSSLQFVNGCYDRNYLDIGSTTVFHNEDVNSIHG